MQKELPTAEFLTNGQNYFLPSVSLDNVIFGFHQNELKVLLLQPKLKKEWVLPGGFIFKDEEIEDAAARILKTRTGLNNIFLQQFHVFGSAKRSRGKVMRQMLQTTGTAVTDNHWLLQRFITIGYYALVDYDKVNAHPDEFSNECTWWDINKLPELLFDHQQIIEGALQALRLQLNYQPIGYNLLPKEFTLKNLQSIYETILGRKLDRSNFNRKILGYGILEKKEKKYSGGAHKAPFLYSFSKKTYFSALKNGLDKDF
jgi:ADP-ribose pyrophosphatase YjhB (NUDIX family)